MLLTLNHVGSGALTNAKMFYTEASEPSWKRLDMSPNSSYTVVGGLDPGKSYFFKFHAKLGGKVKQSVTHVTTPPYGESRILWVFECSIEKTIKDDEKVDDDDSGGGCSSGGGDDGLLSFSPKTQTFPIPDKKKSY